MNENEIVTAPEKKKPSAGKIILIVALVVALSAAAFFAFMYYRNVQAQAEAEAARLAQEQLVSDYIADMQMVAINATFGADVCMQEAQTLVSSESDYAANVSRTNHSTVVSALLTYCSDIDDILEKWSTPPEGYEEDFEHVSEARDDFVSLCKQVINPASNPEMFAALFLDAASTFDDSYSQYLQPYVTNWQDDVGSALAAADADLADAP